MEDTISLTKLIELARKFEQIDGGDYKLVLSRILIRNKLVHAKDDIHSNQAREIVEGIHGILEHLSIDKPKILNETDGRILGTRFCNSLCNKTRSYQGTKERFSAFEIYKDTGFGAYNNEVVIPLIINKLVQLGYIVEHENYEISLSPTGKKYCGEEVILAESIQYRTI